MAEAGDIFLIPLGNGNAAVGQVFEKRSGTLALLLIFPKLVPETGIPSKDALQETIAEPPIMVASCFDTFINDCTWPKVHSAPTVFPQTSSPAFRVAGLSFGFLLESYDGKRRRWARWSEINKAPNHYTVSPKWLENAVKAYFHVDGFNWEPRLDKVLFKNVVGFG